VSEPQHPTGAGADPARSDEVVPDVVLPDTGGVDAGPEVVARDSRWGDAFGRIVAGGWVVSLGAVVLAVLAGSVMIAFTDENVQSAAQYFFARPGDTFAAIGQAVGGAYAALFRGAVYNYTADSFAQGIRPLTQSLTYATPLIAAGLGLAVGFRSGLFNIGGQGQMLMAAAAAGWVGFAVDLPAVLHVVVAVAAGVAAGALWAGLAGLLKATTGAHEVIVTIMLNYVAFYLLSYLLATPGLLQAPGSANPKSPPMADSALLPRLLGPEFRLHLGFLLALVAVVLVWWILERSRLGFSLRAVGENPHAARVAGIAVPRSTVLAMLVSGALIGLAGSTQVLGLITTGFSYDIDAGIGFDAITVALLGSSSPGGVLLAGILFGGFKAGGSVMQASQGIPIEIVLVVQSLIVLFIAAPPLVRAVFRLPQPGRRAPAAARRSGAARREEVQR